MSITIQAKSILGVDLNKNCCLFGHRVKGLVTPANGFVTEEKRIKHAEFGYPVTKFISSDARDSSDRFVERLSHIMTVHQMGVSICFIRWKVLNRRNGHHRTSPDKERIHRIRNEHKTDING